MRKAFSIRTATALLAFTMAATSLTAPLAAYADPPGGHPGGQKEKGQGRGGKSDRGPQMQGEGGRISINISFSDSDRLVVRDYFGGSPPGGRCPPGLAKKNNGCLPPGQAKKWMIGHPLPRDVIYYNLPPELTLRMSVPPAGYKYVRVAGDILMIAVGTGLVAAAIEDLARM